MSGLPLTPDPSLHCREWLKRANCRRWAKHLVGRSSALFEAAHEGAYLLQNAALVAGPEPVIVAIKLDQPRPARRRRRVRSRETRRLKLPVTVRACARLDWPCAWCAFDAGNAVVEVMIRERPDNVAPRRALVDLIWRLIPGFTSEVGRRG